MPEVIPSTLVRPRDRKSSQRRLRTGVAQGSNIRQSVGSTRLCQHDREVMAKHIFNLAAHGERDQSKLSNSAFQFCTTNYKAYAASVGGRTDPRYSVKTPTGNARLRFAGVIAGGAISALLVAQVCSGCPRHCLDLNHWRSLQKVSRFAQSHSPINRTVVNHRQASFLRRWWLRVPVLRPPNREPQMTFTRYTPKNSPIIARPACPTCTAQMTGAHSARGAGLRPSDL